MEFRTQTFPCLAAALVCPTSGCNKCAECLSVTAGSHADVELIRTEGLSIKVDEIRDLISRSSWAPSVAAWRVVVIEDADRLTDSAANALLKVVEEPGLRTVWLLCAPTLTDVLPTIRSRCRHLSLRTPSTKAITKLLIERELELKLALDTLSQIKEKYKELFGENKIPRAITVLNIIENIKI